MTRRRNRTRTALQKDLDSVAHAGYLEEGPREAAHAAVAPCSAAVYLREYARHVSSDALDALREQWPQETRGAFDAAVHGTVAEQISAIFDDDGIRFTTITGHELDDVCDDRATSTTTSGDSIRYEFADGSAIVTCGSAWDIGFSAVHDCYCWAGVASDYPETGGHNPACPHAETPRL